MVQSDALKALIQRLTSTPVEDLPNIAYFLASSISACLLRSQDPTADRAGLLHKLKARVSSLLQDRTPEGRITGVIVAKAVVEAGGREILVDIEPWIRGLIGILNKSDPVATKKLAILTISRAFVLTQEYPSIVREVTTPLLPSFNTACLAAIRPKTATSDKGTRTILNPLLSTTLQCWNELLPQHPATFRPFLTRFRPICLSLLSDADTPTSISRSAGALLVALHHSAPKNTATTEWLKVCQDIIGAAHATADALFRSVREDWTATEPSVVQNISALHSNGLQPDGGPDILGLGDWKGVHGGARRLSRLIAVLEASVSGGTAAEVPIPISKIVDLCMRLLSVTIPGNAKDSPYTSGHNPEFGKDEREMLWSELPSLHVQCLNLLFVLTEMFQQAMLPISKPVLDHLTWLFEGERELLGIRISSYSLLKILLPITGPASRDVDVKKLSGMVHHACSDLLPAPISVESHVANDKSKRAAPVNVDSFAGPTKSGASQKPWQQESAVKTQAAELISAFLQWVPASLIPNALRHEIDRTVVLTRDKQALLASVLNPATANHGQKAPASLLPFFAHANSGLEAEAMLRPRMAVIVDKASHDLDRDNEDDESESPTLTRNLSSTEGVLDRLGQALAMPGEADVSMDAISDTLAAGAGEGNTKMTYDTSQPAPKRDFAAMKGNGLNGWHTTDSQTMPVAGADAKKARIETVGLNAPSKDEELFLQTHPATNGHVDSDVAMTGSLLSLNGKLEADVEEPQEVEPVVQLVVEKGVKGKDQALAMADSDSDIPEINIEPDTDEESDEDADMYG